MVLALDAAPGAIDVVRAPSEHATASGAIASAQDARVRVRARFVLFAFFVFVVSIRISGRARAPPRWRVADAIRAPLSAIRASTEIPPFLE